MKKFEKSMVELDIRGDKVRFVFDNAEAATEASQELTKHGVDFIVETLTLTDATNWTFQTNGNGLSVLRSSH